MSSQTEMMKQLSDFRTLLVTKFPPADQADQVKTSIMLAMIDLIDSLRRQNMELVKAFKTLSDIIVDMRSTPVTAEKNTIVEDDSPGRPIDQTPFPTGAKIIAQPTAAPASLDEVNAAAAIPQPDVTSQPATNAAPIPGGVVKKSATKNGSKDANA